MDTSRLRIVQLLLLCMALPTFINAQNAKIKAVENSLTSSRNLIFEDSTVPVYNILDRMKHYNIPSVSLAVINNGKIEWSKAYGYADWTSGRKANVATVYQVASITKSIVGLAVVKLAEMGLLSLSQDIRLYLKTWKLPENQFTTGKTITLRNLLSHTAGLNVHGFMGYPADSPIPTINQILNGEKPANSEAVVALYPVNEHFEYSGGGYTVLRKVLDDAISSQFDSLLQKVVLKPLGMKSSSFQQPVTLSNRNYALASSEDMKIPKGNYYVYPELAAGGMWSTASDIARFILQVQEMAKGQKGAFLTEVQAKEMLTPVLNQYALGFGIWEDEGETYFRHEGENYGFTSVYFGGLTNDKGLVILTNGFPPNGKPFIQELVNSIAITYNWKGIYHPVRKKLIPVTATELTQYEGTYNSREPEMKIVIRRTGNTLELTARRPEKMYPTGKHTFFVASSPDDQCIFSSAGNNGVIDTFEVVKNGKRIIKAIKEK